MRSAAAIVSALTILFLPMTTSADIITVTPDSTGDYVNIQTAIDAASDYDIIELTDGVFHGPGNTGVDFSGTALTVRSQSDDPGLCIIDCRGLGRAFTLESGEGSDCALEGLTVRNGDFGSNPGGALRIDGTVVPSASPTIRNCRFVNNSASHGGAAFIRGSSSVRFEDCLFKRNSSSDHGGALRCDHSFAEFTSCEFDSNTAGGYGGSVYCEDYAHLRVTDCAFTNGRGDRAGAIHLLNSPCKILASRVSGNQALMDYAGAVFCEVSPCTLEHVVFSRNSSQGQGGVLYFHECSPRLSWCTFANNDAGAPAQGAIFLGHSATRAYIDNSILAFTSPGSAISCNGGQADLSCCCGFGNQSGNWAGCANGPDLVLEDPCFVDTISADYHLRPCSPCAPANSPGTCGLIGALGVGDSFRIWHVPVDAPTIQAGIDSAACGDTVEVASATYHEHDIVMKSGITLRSETGLADCVTIDADSLGRVFYFSNVDSAATVAGFTICRGQHSSAGGGVACYDSHARFINCSFQKNVAGSGHGGAIYVEQGSSVCATTCLFSGNGAGYHGGCIQLSGVTGIGNSSATLTDCIFSGSYANSGGGALNISPDCSCTIVGCTFSGNWSSSGGAVMVGALSDSATVTVVNSIFWGDCAGSGSEIYIYDGSSATFTCCDIDPGNVYGTPTWGSGNISQDPMFCDPEDCLNAPTTAGDYYLRHCSPCADAPGCGQVGAYGIGCSYTRAIHVPTDAPTIQAGIDMACPGDTVIVACGTYTWENQGTGDYSGFIRMRPGVYLRSETGDADCVTIDAQQNARTFGCYDIGSDAVIEGFTITGGYAAGVSQAQWGGGMYCVTCSSPTIRRCRFVGNTAVAKGGGLCCEGVSSPHVIDCVFEDNSAGENGGGASSYYSGSSPWFAGCTFSGNSGGTMGGGGLFTYSSSPRLTNTRFEGNSGECGGALLSRGTSCPEVSSCTFFADSAVALGGEIACMDGGSVTMDHTIVSFARLGAAVYCDSAGTAFLTCCDVYGNSGGPGDVADQLDEMGNFSADPMFCDAAGGDVHLASCSPCLDAPGCGLVGALGLGDCPSTAWYVPIDVPTIQAAIDSAGACDTVLVAAGTYLEDVTLKSSILVLSESGPGVTTIKYPGAGPWTVNAGGAGVSTTLRGFTIDGGTMGVRDERAAFACMRCDGNSSPLIAECIFQNVLSTAIECHDNANPTVGGAPENVNQFLTSVAIGNFTSNTIDATYNYWNRPDHGCPVNNYGDVEILPFYDSSLSDLFCNCFTLCVPEHYTGIQIAVDTADEGDTVEVEATDIVYPENVSIIDENLHVRVAGGDGRPTIRSATSPVVLLDGAGSGSRLSGFTIDANGGQMAVQVEESDVSIVDCVITGASGALGRTGLTISKSSALVEDCLITGNTKGIRCDSCSVITISGLQENANDIHGNSHFNLDVSACDSVAATYNYWGTVDRTEFESKILGLDRFYYCWWVDATHDTVYSCYPCGWNEEAGEEYFAPSAFSLTQNRPNPFNPATEIRFEVPSPGSEVVIDVYDVHGRQVKRLVDKHCEAGVWSVMWHGTDANGAAVSSGIYFCRMKAGDFTAARKMVLMQ